MEKMSLAIKLSFLLVTFILVLHPPNVSSQLTSVHRDPIRYLNSMLSVRGRRQIHRLITTGLAAKAALDHMKPTKGILPVPLPLPIPLPIEWEQPPVVIHPQKEIVAAPSVTLKRTEDSKTSSTAKTPTTTTPSPRDIDM